MLSIDEIDKIKIYQNEKIKDLPSCIVFSKSFLSYSKDIKEAKKFLRVLEKTEKLSKVLFILENADEINYNLSTHGDIEKISTYSFEREVLFIPFLLLK